MSRRITNNLFAVILCCIGTALVACFVWSVFFNEGVKRNVKSIKSAYTGGLMRTVTVYDYNGCPVRSWKGKFDISENTNEVFFDIDGKRVIIHGGIVVSEEVEK